MNCSARFEPMSKHIWLDMANSWLQKESECVDVNCLPNEILGKIFSFFTKKELICTVRLVCCRWCNISYGRNLWTTLTANEVRELKSCSIYQVIQRLFCFNHSLKYLCLDCVDFTHEDDLSCTFPVLIPNLCELSLAFCKLEDTRMELLLKKISICCPCIYSLKLRDCNITKTCLEFFYKHHITRLDVSYCKHLTDDFLYTISHWSLRKLSLDGVQWISDKAVEHLLKNCHQTLENLWLDGENLTDEGLHMLRHCQKLTVLKITYCEELTDVTLANVSEMSSLKSLSLRKGKKFTKEGLVSMFRNLTNELYYLDFCDCQTFDDEVVYWLTLASPHLVTLDLTWCWNITDEGLENIVSHGRNIQRLVLIGLYALTGKLFKDTAERLPRLRYLDLCRCNSIIDGIIIDVARKVPSVSIVNYYGNIVK